MTSGYRLAPALAARLLGAVLLGLALLAFVTSVLAAALGLRPSTLLVVFAAGLAAAIAAMAATYALTNRLEVVSLDDDGYRVRLVRGAGVRQARWDQVASVVTADVRGVDCVVLRLRDGGTTSIPVVAIAADRDHFVRDVRERLRRGEDLRPL